MFSLTLVFLAFYGGRTNAVKLYHKIKRMESGEPLEKINYVDICSLYPYVNKYGKYPVGHPEIITEGFRPVNRTSQPYEGLIKCIILPPRPLLHPVLPYRSNGKLMFPLCAMCANTLQTTKCYHSEEQRALKGVWVTLEIYKAIDKGYKVKTLTFLVTGIEIILGNVLDHTVNRSLALQPSGTISSKKESRWRFVQWFCQHFHENEEGIILKV